MKQAVIILAHNDIDQLIHLVEYFSRDCDVFIHIDKKRKLKNSEIERLKSNPQVKTLCQKFKVYWGGFSILKTQMYMLQQAYKNSNAQTFHVISGHDYPIKPLSFFLDFFERNSKYDYIGFGRIKPVGTDLESYYRYQYFFPYDYADNRDELHRKTTCWIKLQRKLHINRGMPIQFERIYCGSQWFSITRTTVQTIIDYTKEHPSFYRRLKFTFAPEETYFLTIILNLCDSRKVINKNYRFIRWHNENGNSPANLGEEHMHLLAESEDIFARKIVSPYSKELIPLIDKYLLKSNERMIMNKDPWEVNSFNDFIYDPGFVEAIYVYCNLKPCYEILDIGCGAGMYVAAFRRLGIFATGIDSNPYTPSLSNILLPKGDKPCQCARIEDIDPIEDYGLVICINVLQYISDMSAYKKAIYNIIELARVAVVVAYDNSLQDNKIKMLTERLHKKKFVENDFATGFFRRHSKKIENIYVYERLTN